MFLSVPTFITLKRKTKADKIVQCNLNDYRNLHHRILNDAKKEFYLKFKPEMNRVKPAFDSWIKDLNKMYWGADLRFKLTYTITGKDKRKFDIANLLCVIEKYADDCLVKDGFFKDDNWQYIDEVVYKFGGVTGKRECILEIEVNN